MCSEEMKIPFREGIWISKSDKEVKLLGNKCSFCNELFFPRKATGICVHCHQNGLDDIELSPLGKITNFTAVLQEPAGDFYHGSVPYSYGLVDLDDGIRVKAHLGGDFSKLRAGVRVRLALKTLYKDSKRNEIQIFIFQPSEE